MTDCHAALGCPSIMIINEVCNVNHPGLKNAIQALLKT